jgi:hypothetical protein
MADPADYAYRSPEVANAYGPPVRSDRIIPDDPRQFNRLMDTSAIQSGRENAAARIPFERATGSTLGSDADYR